MAFEQAKVGASLVETLNTINENFGKCAEKTEIPSSDADTKTSSSNLEATKLFLTGATTQSTTGQTTYSNIGCYIGTDGELYSGGKKVAHAEDVGASGGVSSWNDLTDKPFYEGEIITDTLTWDGSELLRQFIEGSFSGVIVADTFCKIFDAVASFADFENGFTISANGEIIDVPAEAVSEMVYEIVPGLVCVGNLMYFVSDEVVGVDIEGISFPEAGVYTVPYIEGVVSITIPNKEFVTTGIKTLDEKFLPPKVTKLENKVAVVENSVIDLEEKVAIAGDNIITATFSISEENTAISLYFGEDRPKIDWGDGTIDNSAEHTYSGIGEYECKIYGVSSTYEAFRNNFQLKNVIIGNGIKVIEASAFSGCGSLRKIVIGEGITSIGRYAFSDCDNFYRIEFNAIECEDLDVNNYVFRKAGQFTGAAISIGANVKKIPAYLFSPSQQSEDAPNFAAVIFDAGSDCETIGQAAFYGCNKLQTIEIPNGVKTIGSSALAGCSSVASIKIPDGIERIEGGVFREWDSLASIEIPESVTDIGSWAFGYCDKLTTVIFNGRTPPTYYNAFSDCPLLNKIYVPYGCAEAYKNKWAGAYGMSTAILNLIVESDKVAYMSDIADKHLYCHYLMIMPDGTSSTNSIRLFLYSAVSTAPSTYEQVISLIPTTASGLTAPYQASGIYVKDGVLYSIIGVSSISNQLILWYHTLDGATSHSSALLSAANFTITAKTVHQIF